jgi:hypothetical protein
VLTRSTGVRVRSGRPGLALLNLDRKASMASTLSVALSALSSCIGPDMRTAGGGQSLARMCARSGCASVRAFPAQCLLPWQLLSKHINSVQMYFYRVAANTASCILPLQQDSY